MAIFGYTDDDGDALEVRSSGSFTPANKIDHLFFDTSRTDPFNEFSYVQVALDREAVKRLSEALNNWLGEDN